MTRRQLKRRLLARLDHEGGFTLIETVIAITVIFASLVALVYTATIGFRYTAFSRERLQATGLANQVLEGMRALAYDDVTRGLSATELTSDPNIVDCAGTYRFESCIGEEIVSSTFSVGTTVDFLVPHTGTVVDGGLTHTWRAYVTNDDPAQNPYRLIVVVTWANGVLSNAGRNSLKVESLVWSPAGCLDTATHPFAAPCQPYFYGEAQVPTGRISFTGGLHDYWIDFDGASVVLSGTRAFLQHEQILDLTGRATAPEIEVTDSAGTTTDSSGTFSVQADTDPGSTGTELAGLSGAGITAYLEKLNTDCCGESGLKLDVPAGTSTTLAASAAAAAADTYACPTSGTRETDGLGCVAAAERQSGNVSVTMPFDHFAALGTATVVRVAAPSTDSTAIVERDAVTGYDGLVDARASRTLGTIYLGGFPTSGMIAPVGMSTNASLDTNYCLRISGYADTASVLVGQRTTTNPSTTVAGNLFYYNGLGYSSLPVTSSSLSTLSVTCQTTQFVGGDQYVWRVTVSAGAITPATQTTSQTLDPSDSQTRTQAEATVDPISLAIQYDLINQSTGELQSDLTITVELGALLASGDYGEAPS